MLWTRANSCWWVCNTDKMLVVSIKWRTIMQQIQLQKLTCCTNEPTERKTPSTPLVILSPQVQSVECVALNAEWSSPACTNSNTVWRNQSLACLDPPSPESLRNCGARSDKPLICWLRECRQAMLRWWQPMCWGGGGLCWLNTSLPGSHVNFSVSRPLSHGRPLNRKCCSLQGPKWGLRLLCPHDAVHAGYGSSMKGEACSLYATRKECFISNQRTGLFLLASFGVAPFTGATPFPWTHPSLQPTYSQAR